MSTEAHCRFLVRNDIAEGTLPCYAEISMESPKRVLLLGDTLVLAGIRSSLEGDASFEVITLDHMDDIDQELRDLDPDIIIFDTGCENFQFFGSLVHKQTTLILIGIDPDNNQVRVWLGQQFYGLSVNDLIGIIRQHTSLALTIPAENIRLIP